MAILVWVGEMTRLL